LDDVRLRTGYFFRSGLGESSKYPLMLHRLILLKFTPCRLLNHST
jgi:hypothetical protein